MKERVLIRKELESTDKLLEFSEETVSMVIVENMAKPVGIKVQESRMRENLTYGLTRGGWKPGIIALAPVTYSTGCNFN